MRTNPINFTCVGKINMFNKKNQLESNNKPEATIHNKNSAYISTPFYNCQVLSFKGNVNQFAKMIGKIEHLSDKFGNNLRFFKTVEITDEFDKTVPALAFLTTSKAPYDIEISLFTKEGYEIGNIDSFVSKTGEYAYIRSVNNYFNRNSLHPTSTNISGNWKNERDLTEIRYREGFKPGPLKKVATRLYELLVGVIDTKGLGNVEYLECEARDDGSVWFHDHLGFEYTGENRTSCVGGSEIGLIGMKLKETPLEQLKSRGKELLKGVEVPKNMTINKDSLAKAREEELIAYGREYELGTQAREMVEKYSREGNREMIKYWLNKEASLDRWGRSPRAKYDLCKIYEEEKDLISAREWLEKAANQGHKDASYQLSQLYKKDGKEELALQWLKNAARSEHPQALYELAQIHKTEGELSLAKSCLKEASTKKHKDALYEYALIKLDEGNMDLGQTLLYKASKMGNEEAGKLLKERFPNFYPTSFDEF